MYLSSEPYAVPIPFLLMGLESNKKEFVTLFTNMLPYL